MDNAGYRDFFLEQTQQEITAGRLSVAAELLAAAAGFDALVHVGCQDPHPSAFEKHLWPVIDLILVGSGHQRIFNGLS